MNLKQLISEYLEEAKLMQIATVKDNKPWVATVWYVHDEDWSLYFISRRNRRHTIELKKNSHVAGAIVKPHKTLGVKARGIQFEGKALEVSTSELPHAFNLFVKRYPKAKVHIKSVKDIIKNITGTRIYKIKPSRIVLFDEVNFPNDPQQELRL